MKPLCLIWEQIERGGVDALYYKALIHERSLYTTVDELYFDGSTNDKTLLGDVSPIGRTTVWGQSEAHIVSGTVSITDGTTTFVEGTDYTVNYETGVVTRIPKHAIPLKKTVFCGYQWQIRCVDLSTGNPRHDCPQCRGKGFIWQAPVKIKGLMHIPNYDSPFTKLGYFEQGDVEFTVPYNVDLGVGPQGIDNLFLRDRVDVAGESWRIMYKPQSIQMQNQYIAKKLHLRRLKLTPGVSQGEVDV